MYGNRFDIAGDKVIYYLPICQYRGVVFILDTLQRIPFEPVTRRVFGMRKQAHRLVFCIKQILNDWVPSGGKSV